MNLSLKIIFYTKNIVLLKNIIIKQYYIIVQIYCRVSNKLNLAMFAINNVQQRT